MLLLGIVGERCKRLGITDMPDQSEILSAIQPPTEPLTTVWEVSVASLLRRLFDVPPIASKAVGQLDRLGAVRIGPATVGFDMDDVRWDRITAVRTQQMTTVLTASALDRELERVRKVLPPVPGRKWVLDKASAALGDLCRTALDRSGSEMLDRQVVSEIDYRGALGRPRTLTGGLLVAAVLGLVPEANHILLATAERAGARVE